MAVSRSHERLLTALVVLALAALTLAVYWPVSRHPFVNFDDNLYVTENPQVLAGLTGDGLRWAFTAAHASNWHPLTWLSHMLDVELFGLNAGAHHLVNVVFHILNAVLLFVILRRMTGLLWHCAVVAALFAMHPLHVESVAWLSERKDVLSTLFGLLTLAAYLRYVKRPGAGRYLPVAGCFALGLMAKPMLVTLPFLLLLLDWWPLGRWRRGCDAGGITGGGLLLGEKIPLFVLSAASSAVTYLVQRQGGSVTTAFPLSERVANAFLAYVKYIAMMFWPRHLAAIYLLPADQLPWWQGAWAGALLVTLTLFVLRLGGRCPYLPVGWFWYLGTLMPVIGLVQVGKQTMADRYTYIPLVGLFVMLVWGAAALLRRRGAPRAVTAVLSAVLLAALSIQARSQVYSWRDGLTLFSRMLEVSPRSVTIHHYIGNELQELGRLEEARHHYLEAIRLNPGSAPSHVSLAIVYEKLGRLDLAVRHYRVSVRLEPRDAIARYNLGVALLGTGRPDEAVIHLEEALRIDPSYAAARAMLEYVGKRAVPRR